MRIVLSILLVLLFVPTWSGEERLPVYHAPMHFRMTPVPLDPDDPTRRRLGKLTYLGGVRLSSRDPAFGGFSSMVVDGDRFTLLSDFGSILRFRMDAGWHVTAAQVGELPDGPSRGWLKSERDSESMTRDPRTGALWVGFEWDNAIWRYGPDFTGTAKGARPPAMEHWPIPTGAESLVRLHDGRFLVIAERSRSHGHKGTAALVFPGDPVERPGAGFGFRYRPPPGYDPSDATQLPDGRLVVLNRRLAWPDGFSAKLVVIDPAALRPTAEVRGREIATIAKPLTRDNFEALAATREDGHVVLWIASDDNQTFFEGTFLMKFRLDDR